MKRFLPAFLMAILLLQACSSPTPVAPDPETGYSLDTRTGIEEIDNVLAAAAGGTPDDLYKLIQFTEAPCTTMDGLGGPPKCREGEAEGTILEVLPFLGSEGSFIRRNEINTWKGIDATGLYAVYRISENALNEAYYPPGEYMVVFMPQEDQTATVLRIAQGGIVRVDDFFGSFPDSVQGVIERDTSEVILPPVSR